ncbi:MULTISPECIES: hypothetical protein [unclassified Streptomyces]|uniref:hypothetical protein n=1 Tax=unclassified Streptomyces TaxID=2593676 RepID=UPI002E329CE5|nr:MULTISPECIES: hypothetical protein [unclassified Streptomyces]WUC67442.1 hypothetical protein OG861_26270 [Streptomyces sp. NBC_00539]
MSTRDDAVTGDAVTGDAVADGSGYGDHGGAGATATRRSLWVEEPARRYRMPDPVRASAVRAVLIVALTLMQATVSFFLTLTGSWLALPMGLGAIAGTVVATWAVLDVLITRQMWNQRHGVLSRPSSTARDGGREERRTGREARSGAPGRVPRIRPAEGGRLAAHGRG